MKRFLSSVGLTAVLAAVFIPVSALGAYITVTETTPTTITIDTDLGGQLTSSFFTVPLIHGYYNNRAPYLQFVGPDVESNDSDGGAGQVAGSLEAGDSSVDQPNPGYPGTAYNAINWIDPESTPGNTLYDTLTFDGPTAAPDTSFLFSSENEVPTFGLQGLGICYGDNGFPVDCPIVSYGTVVNAFYSLEGAVNNVPFDNYGAITITFIDQTDEAGTPEPATWMMMLSGIGAAALLHRRRI